MGSIRLDTCTALVLRTGDEPPELTDGELRTEVFTWLVPADVLTTGPGRLPRSITDVVR